MGVGGEEGWRKIKIKKKTTFKSFLEEKQEENKRNHPKTNPERRNVFGFSQNLLQLLGKRSFPVP